MSRRSLIEGVHNRPDRSLEATVWSQPGLSSDMPERRIAAKIGSANLLNAILKARG